MSAATTAVMNRRVSAPMATQPPSVSCPEPLVAALGKRKSEN